MDISLPQRLVRPDAVGRTEADIQSDVKMLLLSGGFNLGDEQVRLEDQLGDGTKRRIDVAIGATVIEVKKRLRDEDRDADYIAQLSGYVRTRIQQEGSRYNGILTDGRTWWLYETAPGTQALVKRTEFTLASAERGPALVDWLQSVLATRTDVTPTQKTIETLLGAASPAYQQDHSYLEDLFAQAKDDPTVMLKRALWERLLRSALGTGFSDEADHLFLDHTLLVIEAAAIAHAVMGIPLEGLSHDPARLLRGDEFEAAQIYNAVESDFFDWVLSVPDGSKFVARIIRRVNTFNWHRTEHDVLKVLYESVINPGHRKGMGEYYTPDWLADGIVQKVVTEPLSQRVLDPACGSGTFVFHAVRRVATAAAEAGWDNSRILEHVQNHVFGLDLHPVSVLLARVTYLLALGERLQRERGALTLPVHLGDSMQWYQPAGEETDTISIKTDGLDLTAATDQGSLFQIGQILAFPLANVEDPATFDRLVSEMTETAKGYTNQSRTRPRVEGILSRFGIPAGGDRDTLTETFNVLCDLNAEGKDSIWGYFVRNQVRPLWLSMSNRRVDVLVGNPPWVAYRFMTESMQQQFKRFSEDRNLWHGKKVATNQDLVGLFIVRTVEKYLRAEGTFGFVTPLAVLSRQQYAGFRTGDWGTRLRGELTEMWDLEQVKPKGFFPVPAGVIYGIRHDREPIGEDYTNPPAGAPGIKVVVTGSRDRSGWAATLDMLTLTEARNVAIDGDERDFSPYHQLAVQGAVIVPRYLWFVTEQSATSRLGRAAGTTSVHSLRSSQEKEPWKSLPDVSGVVPSRFIFDVHLGSTVVPFRLLDPWRAVLPISKGKLLTLQQIQDEPQLHEWWRQASDVWEANKTAQSKLTHMDNLNYQNKMTRQLNGATYRVLYPKAGTRLAAVWIDDPKLIVDHKLYWVAVRSVDEARYLTAILNAPETTARVSEYQSRGLIGGRDFDRYVWHLPVPTYDAKVPLHRQLIELAVAGETAAADLDLEGHAFQKARGIVRDSLGTLGIQGQLDKAVIELLGPAV